MSEKGRIHSEESFSTLDGPGVRYVVFLQGCPLRCKYCHNVDSWDVKRGIVSTAEECAKRIIDCRNFIGGVTLSGGEPLLQAAFCREVLERCKTERLHTAIDTSGAVPLKSSISAVKTADMILLDIKSSDAEICRKLTGADNKNSIALLDWCEKNSKRVWIRHVVLRGYTLSEKQLADLGRMLSGYACIERIELLPFHKMGEFKWKDSGRSYELYDTPVPTDEEMKWAKKLIGEYDKRIK